MKNWLRSGLATLGLMGLLALTACNSSGTLAVSTPKAEPIPAGKVVALNVTSAEDEDSRDAAGRMQDVLFGRLVDGGRLTVDVDAEGQTVLDIQPAGRSGDKPKAEAAAL